MNIKVVFELCVQYIVLYAVLYYTGRKCLMTLNYIDNINRTGVDNNINHEKLLIMKNVRELTILIMKKYEVHMTIM